MRESINGVSNLGALIEECKEFLGEVNLSAAQASGDVLGYIVKAVQSEMVNGEMRFPFTNGEVVEIYQSLISE